MPVKCQKLLFEHNYYIPHVGNVRGETGMDFQEDPFPGSGVSDKIAHCCSRNVLIIMNYGSQKKTYACFIGNV